jgi:hypothetical protein
MSFNVLSDFVSIVLSKFSRKTKVIEPGRDLNKLMNSSSGGALGILGKAAR